MAKAQVQTTQGGVQYDPYVALDFFKSAGKAVNVDQGETLFDEDEKSIPILRSTKMYLLLKGEVALAVGNKTLATLRPGDIFGELAVLAHAPRSAAAVARSPVTVIGLDDGKFAAALRKKPAFALMLMGVMIRRMRETLAQLKGSSGLKKDEAWKEAAVFDPKQLAEMADGLSKDPTTFFRAGTTVITEGQKGVRMYVVMEGRVAISIGGRVVERLGPGGVFGEAALVDGSTRLANAVAETDCELLPITRNAFMALVKLSPDFADTMLSSLSERLRFLTSRLG